MMTFKSIYAILIIAIDTITIVSFFDGGIRMKKVLISGMGLGISLMSAPIPGIKDVCILLTIKIFNLKNPDVSPYFCCILGLIIFIICFKEYKNYRKNDHIINIVGFGNNGYWEKNNTFKTN